MGPASRRPCKSEFLPASRNQMALFPKNSWWHEPSKPSIKLNFIPETMYQTWEALTFRRLNNLKDISVWAVTLSWLLGRPCIISRRCLTPRQQRQGINNLFRFPKTEPDNKAFNVRLTTLLPSAKCLALSEVETSLAGMANDMTSDRFHLAVAVFKWKFGRWIDLIFKKWEWVWLWHLKHGDNKCMYYICI